MIIIAFLVLLTIISPTLSIPVCLFALLFVEKKQKKYILIIFSFAIGAIVFNIIPNKSMDLYRYFEKIDYYRTGKIDFYNDVLKSDPITYFLMYIVSKTNNNHYLPLISIIIFYLFYYRAIEIIMRKYDLTSKGYNIVILYMLSLVIIIGTATGVRFSLAIAFFLNGIAYMINNKKIGIVWFIIAALSHSTLLIPIAIYLFIIIKKNKVKWNEWLLFSIILISPSLLSNIFGLFNNIPILSDLSIKFGYYFHYSMPGGTWYIFRMIIFSLNLCFLARNLKFKNDYEIGAIVNLQIALAIICILTIPYYFISIRFINIFNHLSIILMIYNISKNKNKKIILIIVLITTILYGSYQYTLFTESKYNFNDLFDNYYLMLK